MTFPGVWPVFKALETWKMIENVIEFKLRAVPGEICKSYFQKLPHCVWDVKVIFNILYSENFLFLLLLLLFCILISVSN